MKWLNFIIIPIRLAVWRLLVLMRPLITGLFNILVIFGLIGIIVFGISWFNAEVPKSVFVARNLFLTSIGMIVVFGPLAVAYDKLLFWLEPRDRTVFYT